MTYKLYRLENDNINAMNKSLWNGISNQARINMIRMLLPEQLQKAQVNKESSLARYHLSITELNNEIRLELNKALDKKESVIELYGESLPINGINMGNLDNWLYENTKGIANKFGMYKHVDDITKQCDLIEDIVLAIRNKTIVTKAYPESASYSFSTNN